MAGLFLISEEKFSMARSCFIVLLLLITQLTTAQELRPHLGVKGGINLSNMHLGNVSEENALTSYHAGLFYRWQLFKKIAVQPEFLYSPTGAQITYNRDNVSGTVVYTLRNITLPLLLQVNINKFFKVHLGPYAGLLINVGVINKTSRQLSNFEKEVSYSNFHPLDYGFAGGAEFEFAFINIGLRYNLGLQNIGREKSFFGQPYSFPEARNYLFQLYTGIIF